MKKIFLSYTLRGKDLTAEELFLLKNNLNILCIRNYIDFIDNDYSNFFKKINISLANGMNSIAQKNVVKSLISSYAVIVLDSDFLHESEWVDYEINLAKKYNICYQIILKNIWKEFLLEDNYEKLLKTDFFRIIKNYI